MPTKSPTPAQQLDVKQWKQKHENDLELLLGAFEKDVNSRLPGYAEGVMKRSEGVKATLTDFFSKATNIRSSGEYSAEGERTQISAAARHVREKLDALHAATVGKLDEQLAAKRAAALQPKAAPDGWAAVIQEMKRREMRDHLSKLDPLMLQARIRQAVGEGASTDLLDALEGAPAGFSIAPPELLQEVRVALAERDHPELGELAQLRQVYTLLLGTARQSLIAATGGDHEAFSESTRKPFTSSGTPVPEIAR
jgi:hypothetical protein